MISALIQWLARRARTALNEAPPRAHDHGLDALRLEDRVLYSVTPLPDAGVDAQADAGLDAALTLSLDQGICTGLVLPTADLAPHADAGDASLHDADSDGSNLAVCALPFGDMAVCALPGGEISASSDPNDAPSPGAARHELILVDQSIHNVQQLVDSLLAEAGHGDIDVVYLDSAQDGFAQVDHALSGDTHYDAVHFVTHGDAGMIRLGGSWLDATTIEQRIDQIQQWSDSLSEDADLLFYGCETAVNPDGAAWLGRLSELSGADVAASDDNTGSADRGGDWDLEYHTGTLETASLFSAAGQDSWDGLLATYVVTNTNDSGAGSFRQAIIDANANVGLDSISFNIATSDPNYNAGLGVWRIQPLSDLTAITDDVVLDAWTQPGFAGNPVIELDGSLASGSSAGLMLRASNSTIRGFIVHSFADDGIEVDGLTGEGDNNVIRGNWIGINASGVAAANGDHGLLLTAGSANNVVGGTGANDRNVISGNTHDGIHIRNANSNGNVIVGNYIGVGVDGVTSIGNGLHGIELLDTPANNRIGGVNAGEGNIIANNGGTGISVHATAGNQNAFLGNSIYSNTGLGIDLNEDGVTANDAMDADTGANDLQNYVVITSANRVSNSQVYASGNLNAAANSYYRVEFYISNSPDPSGHGEGRTYLGYVNAPTDASGNVGGALPINADVALGAYLSVTVTQTNATYSTFYSTSEFSQAVAVSNTAPTLNTVGSPALTAVNEDAAAPVGAVGTLVSQLVDFASPAGQVDNVTDPDPGALLGIAITGADANGTWYYSTNNGANWILLGAVSDANARLLSADGSTRLYFHPNADFNGTIASALTIRAWDRTSGTNGTTADTSTNGGTTAFSSATDAVSLSVTAVNDAPVNNVPVPQNTNEDAPLVFNAGNGNLISITDVDVSSGNLTVTLAGTNGVITLGGTTGLSFITGDGTADASLQFTGTLANVNAALNGLSFNATANFSGAASVAMTTSDNGNTGSGGTLTDNDTIAITVNPVDDAPHAADERLALNLDGTDDFVNAGSSATLTMTNTMTMEAWVNPDVSANVDQMIINKEGEYEVAIFANGHLEWAFANTTPGWGWHDTGLVVSPGQWTHIAVTYNNGVVTTYANGVSVDVFNGTGAIGDAHPAFNDLRIGGRTNSPAGQYFDGRIDEVRIWNVVRTGAEISGAMNTELTGAEAGLAGYWNFNENSGTSANDLTANNNDGTLTNGAGWYGYRITEDGTINSPAPGVLANDFDEEGNSLTAVLFSGPTNGSLTLNPDGSFSYTPTLNFTGTDSFSYRAFDGTSFSNVATVTILVDPVNDAPTITSNGGGAMAAISIAENTSAVATVISSDPDGGVPLFTISGGNDAALFTIDGATGALSFLSAPDREALTDSDLDGVYEVTVQVADGLGGFDTQALSVTITDANEFTVTPVVDVDAAASVINENAANGSVVGITALASDADATTNGITYSLDDSAGGRFAIDGVTGVVTVADSTLLDREAAASHNVIIRATSADGSFSTQSFTINLNDVDEFDTTPIADVNAAGNVVNENASNGSSVGITASAIDGDATNSTIVYSLDDDAGGRFAIDGVTGVVTVADGTLLDREAAASHNVIIRASSADGSFSTQSFTININDVDEFDVGPIADVNAAGNAVAENAANGTAVGITAQANDADATASGITYSLDDTAGGRFAIDATTGVVTVADGTLLDADAAASHTITVRAASADGSFSTQVFTINVTDQNDNDPVITSNGGGAAAAISLAENTSAVTTVVAADADLPAQSLTFSIVGGVDAARFTINATTGALTFVAAPDFEAPADVGADNVYDVTVQVDDGAGRTDSQALTVTITAVNETPVAQGENFTLANTETLTRSGPGLLANDSDPDGDVLSAVLVTGPQHGTLTLNPDGSFTYTPDANFAGTDSFTYQSTDGTLASAPIVVQMTVTQSGGPLPPNNKNDDSGSGSGGNDSPDDNPDGDPTVSGNPGNDPGARDNPFRPTNNSGPRDRRSDDSTPDVVIQPESHQRAASSESTQPNEAPHTLSSALKGARRVATAAERIATQAFNDVLDADQLQLNLALVNLRNEVESAAQLGTYLAGSVAIASAATSAGYALWALRSAHFVTSFLATIPAWRRFDPLPLINSPVTKRRDEGESLSEIAMGIAPASTPTSTTAPMEGSS